MAHEAGASLGWGSLAVELPLLFSTTAAWEPSQLQLAALLSLCCLVAFYSLRYYSDAQGKRVAAAGPEVSSSEVKTPFASLSERTESFKAAFQSALNYPWAMIENPVSFAFVESEQNRTLVEAVKACGAYAPTPWVVSSIGGHIQSAMFAMWCPPKVWRQTGKMTCKKDLVKVRMHVCLQEGVCMYACKTDLVESSRDGGAFGVVWWDASAAGAPLPSTAPVVIMLPGVVGKPDNIYLKRMALHLAHRYGWRTVVKGWRGLGTELTTPRPETWDDTALQDLLDVIAYVRGTIGPGVPMFGVGFSFGGALLTTAVGTVPRAVHTLSAVVSVSGLFDFGSMLKHVETQWGWLYDAMNAKVTVANYKRFKVLDVVCTPARSADTAATSAAHAAATEGFSVDAAAAVALPEEQRRRQQQQQRADAAAAAANTVAAAADDTSHTVLASGTVTPAGGDVGSNAATAAGEQDAAAAVAAAVAAAAAPAAKLQSDGSSDDDAASEVEEVVTISSLGDIGGNGSAAYSSSSSRSAGPTVTVIGDGGSGGGAAVAVKTIPALEESELAAIKGHRDFHSIFTVPFSGDASVDDYIVRVERMHAIGRARVNVPVLALLAEVRVRVRISVRVGVRVARARVNVPVLALLAEVRVRVRICVSVRVRVGRTRVNVPVLALLAEVSARAALTLTAVTAVTVAVGRARVNVPVLALLAEVSAQPQPEPP
ncbi:hypothetical protein JKP88DRAFT_317537 [Tribonema minus]|uniref:Serine aminopeptidase S33 domain-containing protein n=1 Tax=Tribonema minus TaxID=303371 RepID=A0A835YXD5_9STRA|nr:hypothetical protein JKP88DRAFT_317537 [Tribonema minus]